MQGKKPDSTIGQARIWAYARRGAAGLFIFTFANQWTRQTSHTLYSDAGFGLHLAGAILISTIFAIIGGIVGLVVGFLRSE